MTKTPNRPEIESIRRQLDANHPGVACREMAELISSAGLHNLRGELDRISSGYNYMVNYMLQHGEDTGHEAFFIQTREELRTLADRLERELKAIDSPDLYDSRVRTMRLTNVSLSDITGRLDSLALLAGSNGDDASQNAVIQRNREQELINLFNFVWSRFPLTSGDLKLLTERASSDEGDFIERSQIISALFLGLLQYYEKGRVVALLDIYERSADVSVKARALMALVLGMYAQRQRIAGDREIELRLQSWLEQPGNGKRLRHVVMDIVRTLDTDRINKELKEDFLPKMQKMKPHIDKILRKSQGEGTFEENPDWEEMMRDSGLDSKLKELTELQNEGADLMMFAFSNLKNFGFFNELSNWFLPFDTRHSQIRDSLTDLPSAMVQLLDTPGMMCDSDKYSFVLSLTKVPQTQRTLMFSQLSEQEEALRQAIDEAALSQSTVDNLFNSESTRYIRDLNRFLKLFRERRQFTDILRHPFVIEEIPFPKSAVSEDSEFVRIVGEFYLRRKYFRDAVDMFLILEGAEGFDPSLPEKIGYCYHQLHDYTKAMTYYRKAELFNPDSLWLIKRMASASRLEGIYVDAIEFYSRALESEPDNTSMLMNLGGCLTQEKRYEKALKLYYKVNYLKPEHINSLRAIAWTEFLAGDYDKSVAASLRVLEKSRELIDLVNAGHSHLASGNFGKAYELYSEGAKCEGGVKAFNEMMENDRPDLLKAGCRSIDIDIIVDRINSNH